MKRRRKKITPVKAAAPVRRRPRRRRRNSDAEQAARNLFQTFHGKPSDETTVIVEDVKSRDWHAQLGDLVSLEIVTPTGYDVAIEFDRNRPVLTASPDGRQLYIMGGDQRVALDEFEMDGPEWARDLMVLGVLGRLTYQTQKSFHAFELVDYYHDLGEESGVVPVLVYDRLNQKLSIVGGQYEVRLEGITN